MSRTTRKFVIATVMSTFGLMNAPAEAVCSQEGNKYTCSGADHDTQNLTGDVLDVVLDGTSYINTDSGYGLSVTGSSLTITQQEGGIIVADGSGINIENTGTGDTTLNISGTVVAKRADGIEIITSYEAGAITLIQEAGTISGEQNGIQTQYMGTADTFIAVSGEVKGESNNGINALNGSTAKNLSIMQSGGKITGRFNGIQASNQGTGNTSIITTSDVSGEYAGVFVDNHASAQDILVMQSDGSITGGHYGIYAYNHGIGDTTILTAGNVTGTNGSGIYVDNAESANNLSIVQSGGKITGGEHGIYANNHSRGDTSVTTRGEIVGENGSGVSVSTMDGGDIAFTQIQGKISGTQSGIDILNRETGATTVNISGEVIGGSVAGINTDFRGNDGKTTINLNQGADISAASGIAIRSTHSDATVNLNNGAKVSGQILLGNGNNILNLNQGSDVSGLTVINGNDDDDPEDSITTLNINQSLTGSSFSEGAAGDVAILNWNIINVGNAAQTRNATLTLSGDLNADQITIASGGRVNVSSAVRDVTLAGKVNNAGSLDLGIERNSDNRLTIEGDYSGDNGNLVLNSVLEGDNGTADRLIVNGDTAGHTWVSINNLGGQGALTDKGIEIVTVKGDSAGTFAKSGRIVAGAYDYDVVKKDSNWFLASEKAYRPEFGSYLANARAANTLFHTRLHDRLGETQYTDRLTGEQKVTSLWMRHIGGHNRFRDASGKLHTQSNRYVMQLGGDIAQWSRNGLDRWHLGLMTGYANNQSRTHSKANGYTSRGDINGYSVGLYGTWYANQKEKTGAYVDAWMLYNWFDNQVTGQNLATEKYHADGITAALETGYTFQTGESRDGRTRYWLQPKIQLTWMDVQADDHIENNGTQVVNNTNGNLQTRLGMKFYQQGNHISDEGKDRTFQPFIEANWIHNTHNDSVMMNGISNAITGARDVGELKLGVEGQINARLQLWGNVAQQLGDNGFSDTQGTLGIKYQF